MPSYFIKISQSEIVNLKEIERFNITLTAVEIHLKTRKLPTHHAVTSKQ
ncbi:MAG: hypothetical protein ACLTOX_04065 [Streptococcus thermophilus]